MVVTWGVLWRRVVFGYLEPALWGIVAMVAVTLLLIAAHQFAGASAAPNPPAVPAAHQCLQEYAKVAGGPNVLVPCGPMVP